VKLLIFLHNGRRVENILVIDPARINNYLDMPPEEVKKLIDSIVYPKEKDIKTKRHRQDLVALGQLYNEMLETGKFKNRAYLARHFGVSRSWITKVGSVSFHIPTYLYLPPFCQFTIFDIPPASPFITLFILSLMYSVVSSLFQFKYIFCSFYEQLHKLFRILRKNPKQYRLHWLLFLISV
jgi:hypothetical protein